MTHTELKSSAIVISDLHLAENTQQLNRRFIQLLEDIITPQLYILGDLFEVWCGDDIKQNWLKPIIKALIGAKARGITIYFQHGNRDFLVGVAFAKKTGIRLLPEQYIAQIDDLKILLMHGDSLCTDDKQYQKFRRLIRNPLILFVLRSLPQRQRLKIALKLRNQSKRANRKKSDFITDVNLDAVKDVVTKHRVAHFIHGHTHRPNIHTIDAQNKRYVLGDWGEKIWWIQIRGSTIQLQSQSIQQAVRL